MATQVIKDAQGLTLGRIITDAAGRQRAVNARGLTVGHYDPKTDRTTDSRGLKVTQGNALAALVVQSKS